MAIYRFLLGDFAPYMYRTDDYGKSWTKLTDGKNGIAADEPTRVVREDPGRAGLLYAGTDKHGLICRIDANGKGYVLYQAPQGEVRSLLVTPEAVYAGTAAPTRKRGNATATGTSSGPGGGSPSLPQSWLSSVRQLCCRESAGKSSRLSAASAGKSC